MYLTSSGTGASDFSPVQNTDMYQAQTICQVLTILKECTVKKSHPWTHSSKVSANKDIQSDTVRKGGACKERLWSGPQSLSTFL